MLCVNSFLFWIAHFGILVSGLSKMWEARLTHPNKQTCILRDHLQGVFQWITYFGTAKHENRYSNVVKQKKKKSEGENLFPVGNRNREFFMLLSHFTDGATESQREKVTWPRWLPNLITTWGHKLRYLSCLWALSFHRKLCSSYTELSLRQG